MITAQLASTAIQAIQDWYVSAEEAAENLEELDQRFSEINDTLRENQEMADETVKSYEELSKGVDAFGNNVALTEEEFSEYNDLSNQIAEKFPELVTGYTDSGNAILSFKNNVELLNEALQEENDLLHAEQVLNADDVFENTYTEYKNGKTTSQAKNLNSLLSLGRDVTVEDMKQLGISTGDLKQIFKDAEVDYPAFASMQTMLDELNKHTGTFAAYFAKINKELEQASSDVHNQTVMTDLQYNSDFTEYYDKLSEEQRTLVDNLLNSFDYVELSQRFQGDADSLMDFIISTIETMTDESHKEFQNALKKMYDIDEEDRENTPYSVVVKTKEEKKAQAFAQSGLLTAGYASFEEYETELNTLKSLQEATIELEGQWFVEEVK